MGEYCQKCRSLEKGMDLFQREKKISVVLNMLNLRFF